MRTFWTTMAANVWCAMAVLHGSGAARYAPYPRRISGGAFELWAAEFSHPVKNACANSNFGFLILERPCFEFGPDHDLPATHQGFATAALIVARSPLPFHSSVRSYFCNMAITNARAPSGVAT